MSISTKVRGLREIWQFRNRWYLAFSRLFFPNENVLTYRFGNVEFLSDHSAGDTNGAREVLTTPMYRQYIEKINLPTEINVFDLGTNNGGFPLLLRSSGLNIKKLLCVELNPNTFTRLRFNLDRNFGNVYTALNCAVAGENGTLSIDLGSGSVGDNIYKTNGGGLDHYTLEKRTFDDLFGQTFGDSIVDICKMDVEGAEFEIFGSESAQKARNCRYILIEIHQEVYRSRDDVRQQITELGFVEIDGKDKNEQNAHYVHLFENVNL